MTACACDCCRRWMAYCVAMHRMSERLALGDAAGARAIWESVDPSTTETVARALEEDGQGLGALGSRLAAALLLAGAGETDGEDLEDDPLPH